MGGKEGKKGKRVVWACKGPCMYTIDETRQRCVTNQRHSRRTGSITMPFTAVEKEEEEKRYWNSKHATFPPGLFFPLFQSFAYRSAREEKKKAFQALAEREREHGTGFWQATTMIHCFFFGLMGSDIPNGTIIFVW